MMRRLNQGYQVLGDPARRADYNRTLRTNGIAPYQRRAGTAPGSQEAFPTAPVPARRDDASGWMFFIGLKLLIALWVAKGCAG